MCFVDLENIDEWRRENLDKAQQSDNNNPIRRMINDVYLWYREISSNWIKQLTDDCHDGYGNLGSQVLIEIGSELDYRMIKEVPANPEARSYK